MTDDEFERLLAAMRRKLHRYCARMVGSAVDGEDVVQEVLIKALSARASGAPIGNLEGWLFRVAHNASLDLLRVRKRANVDEFTGDIRMEGAATPDPELVVVSFRAFLALAPLQRCAVVLKDVLGYAIEEIAEIAGCSAPAAKSALQRGRVRLRDLAKHGIGEAVLPLIAADELDRLVAYVHAFRTGEFDIIRGMLADEVRLDLVDRLKLEGRERVSPYFTRYAEASRWRYAPGAVDGRPVMLVYDHEHPSVRPTHFVVLEWNDRAIVKIRDFVFASYVLDGADWIRLD